MRTVLVMLVVLFVTPVLATVVIVAAMLGIPDRRGGIFDLAPRWWAAGLVKAAGARIVLHNAEHIPADEARVYVANHVSWFDVFALAATLSHYKFIAKAELERIPLFGRAVRAAGFIFIDRNNRKAAFTGYEAAAERIRHGASVVVHPEGTRGHSYALRPFKKGPFVLAVAAGVPIVPTLVYGTREIQRKGSFIVRPGAVHVHFLEPIPTAGMTYDDRDRLSRMTWERMAAELERIYGIASAPVPTPSQLEAMPA
ncbi:MAG: lysophospholipid acyltransferase family protein [Gemmatimonadaceae bacterium]